MSALEDKLRELGIGVGWNHPFFLPALSRLTITEDATVPTMRVRMDGHVKVNKDFANSLPDPELAGVLFHEIMHLMMKHAYRQEGRTLMCQDTAGNRISLFNVAADMAINNVLKEMGVRLPAGALYPPSGREDMNAEQLYELLASDPDKGGMGRKPTGGRGKAKKDEAGGGGGAKGEGDGEPAPCAGCGVDPVEGKGEGGAGDQKQDGNGQGQSQPGEAGAEAGEDWEREWEKVAVQARNIAAGTEAGKALARLFEKKQPMRWKQLLKSTVSRAVAQHGRDEQTMTKRNRRSPARLIYPGWRSTKVKVGIIVDDSGSVSDEQLTKIVDEIQEIAKVGEARLYLVVHDAVVQFSGWVDGSSRERVARTFIGRGGTRFSVAYEEMDRVHKKFDAVIHLTDGFPCEPWPPAPRAGRRFVVALVADCQGGWPAGTQIVRVKV